MTDNEVNEFLEKSYQDKQTDGKKLINTVRWLREKGFEVYRNGVKEV